LSKSALLRIKKFTGRRLLSKCFITLISILEFEIAKTIKNSTRGEKT